MTCNYEGSMYQISMKAERKKEQWIMMENDQTEKCDAGHELEFM